MTGDQPASPRPNYLIMTKGRYHLGGILTLRFHLGDSVKVRFNVNDLKRLPGRNHVVSLDTT